MSAKEATLEAVEKTIDVVEETLETVERIPKAHLNGTTKKQQIIILTVTALAAAAAGGGITYFLTNRKLKFRYEEIAEDEIRKARDFYRTLNKEDELSDPEKLAEQYEDEERNEFSQEGLVTEAVTSLRSYQGDQSQSRPEKEEIAEPPVVVTNVFVQSQGATFDYEAERDLRRNGGTYIITSDEFHENEPEYEQQTVTYFAGDDTLVDQREEPIHDIDGTVGSGNLNRFGHGSGDVNVVYVRNEKLELDFEVLHSEGKYSYEVLGFEEELKHSDMPTRRKRPRSDDG